MRGHSGSASRNFQGGPSFQPPPPEYGGEGAGINQELGAAPIQTHGNEIIQFLYSYS